MPFVHSEAVLPRPFSTRTLAAFAGLSLVAIGLTVACGDSDSGETPTATATSDSVTRPGGATGTTSSGNGSPASPVIEPPVSQYSILVQDLGAENFLTDLGGTKTHTVESYAGSGAFENAESGIKNLTAWGYIEGFRTALIPEGGTQAILNGGYVVHHELHLFTDSTGASEAFEYFRETVSTNGISSPVETATTGNASFTSRTVAGKVGGASSTVNQVLHQVIFRRGNVVAVVLTIGAEPLMQVDTVLELSAMIDEKLMDEREHPEPTPIPSRTAAAEATAAR